MKVVWRRKPLRNHLSTQTNLPPAVNGPRRGNPHSRLESVLEQVTLFESRGAREGLAQNFDHEPAWRVEIERPRAVQAGRLWDLVAILP
jgi:hypothetical protein